MTETNLMWRCQSSGYCCTQMERVILTEIDIFRIFKMTGAQAESKDLVHKQDPYGMNRLAPTLNRLPKKKKRQMQNIIVAYDLLEKPRTRCRFFTEDDQCEIYNTRPIACKGYPISLYPHPSGSEITLTISSDCPSGPDLYNRVMINHEPVVFPIQHLWDIQESLCARVLIASTYQLVFENFEHIVIKPMGLLEYHARAMIHAHGGTKISLRAVFDHMERSLNDLAASNRVITTMATFFKLTEDKTGFTIKSKKLQAQGHQVHLDKESKKPK